jgi:hypothetical protein
MTKLIIDECLSAELALMARERGHHDASLVVWIGKSGWKDWELKEILPQEDWVLVTWNCKDFRGPRMSRDRRVCSQMFNSIPASYASMDLLGWTLTFSGFFFNLSSKSSAPERPPAGIQPDLTNQVLAVAIDESGERVDIVRYEFPADTPIRRR